MGERIKKRGEGIKKNHQGRKKESLKHCELGFFNLKTWPTVNHLEQAVQVYMVLLTI